MEKNKKKLETLLNLESIAKLINILAKTQNIKEFREDNIEFDSKKYCFSKSGDTIVVECSDGKKLGVKIGTSLVNYGVGIIKYHNSVATYFNQNGDELSIPKSYSQRINQSEDLTNEFIESDLSSAEFAYYNKNNNTNRSLMWNDEDNKFHFQYGLDREYNGYTYSTGVTKYLLSDDLDKISAINGKVIPDLEEVKRFNLGEETIKFNSILKENKLNELSKQLIEELLNNLKLKDDFAKQIISEYETILPKCKKILDEENEVNEKIRNMVFSKKELLFIVEVVNEIIKCKLKEQDINTTNSKTKIK